MQIFDLYVTVGYLIVNGFLHHYSKNRIVVKACINALVCYNYHMNYVYRKKQPKTKGFTILEIVIAIGIIGILVGIAFVPVTIARKKARDAVRRSDLRSVRTALESYYQENMSYPATSSYGESNSSAGGWDVSFVDDDGDGIFFMDFLQDAGLIQTPIDPTNNSNRHYRYRYFDGIGQEFGCEKPYYVLMGIGFEYGGADEDNGVCFTQYAGDDKVLIIVGGMD